MLLEWNATEMSEIVIAIIMIVPALIIEFTQPPRTTCQVTWLRQLCIGDKTRSTTARVVFALLAQYAVLFPLSQTFQ